MRKNDMAEELQQQEKFIFEELTKNFKAHFANRANKQILFSGPFGSGKTTFLRDFAENCDSTVFYHLYPVNYSLHTNEDIYEILKYDLLLQLIDKGAFKENEISKLVAISTTALTTAENVLVGLFQAFSKTGKSIVKLIDLIKKQKNAFIKTVDDLQNPLLAIKDFEALVGKKTSYAYDDDISNLIAEKLAEVKKEKSSVLIIDDLDRIDPEHLFRILSIFSSHVDYATGENRFGYDKIIFVADIENIEAMYAHRFGTRNSFTGYISKLCGKKPFYFDPAKELYNKLSSLINNTPISFDGQRLHHFSEIYLNSKTVDFLVYLMANLLKHNTLNLRTLIEFDNHISISYGESNRSYGMEDLFRLPIFATIKYLESLNINLQKLAIILEKIIATPLTIEEVFSSSKSLKNLYSDMSASFVLGLENDGKFDGTEADKPFVREFKGEKYTLIGYRSDYSRGLAYRLDEDSITAARFFTLFKEAVTVFSKKLNTV